MKVILLFLGLIFSFNLAYSNYVNPDSVWVNDSLSIMLKAHAEKLSSKYFLGRSTLTRHDSLAANYIDSIFTSLKLTPYTQIHSPKNKQPLSILVRTPKDRTMGYRQFNYSYNTDFICLGPDPESGKEYDLVFGGFGDPHEIDSLDLEGKALFILANNLRVGGMKVHETATAKGCSLIIVANYKITNQFELVSKQLEKDHRATRFNLTQSTHLGTSRFFARFGKPIPQILVSDHLAKRLLGSSPSDVASRIEQKISLQPFAPNLRIGFKMQYQTDTIVTNNVISYIPAEHNTQQNVVICAHFDHLTADEYNWYPGADDNASGTSVVIELAKFFSKKYPDGEGPLRNIVFATFTAEEIGLLGSTHYVDNPRFNIDSTTIVINLDMIGRESKKNSDKRILFVDGKNKHTDFIEILNFFNAFDELVIDPKGLDDETLFSVSDHYPFQQKGVPSFLFNTGIHKDYHQPSDTAEKLRYDNMARIFDLLCKTIDHFANQPNPWDFDTTVKNN